MSGQEIDLRDGQGAPLARLQLGVGWDKVPTAGFIGTGAPEVDLDAAALEFSGSQLFDLVFFNNPRTRDGAVVHLGDNRTGRGDGDDEVITLDLARVHAPVDRIVLVVTSYQGHTLEWINNAWCRVLDEAGAELARFTLTGGVPTTGAVLAVLERAAGAWRLRAIGEPLAATTAVEAVPALQAYL